MGAPLPPPFTAEEPEAPRGLGNLPTVAQLGGSRAGFPTMGWVIRARTLRHHILGSRIEVRRSQGRG